MERSKFHFAWIIFIGCCCAYASAMALISSIAGVYMLPVSQDLGVGRGEFALWITVKSLCGVALLPVVGRLFQKLKSINPLMIAASIAMTVGIFGFSISTELWMFYAFAPLLGFGSTTFYSIASPTLIQNWFAKKHRGKFLGIAAAFTGIGTFVWAPLFTVILQNMGWRSAYMINALFILVLTLWFAIVVKRTPQEKGLKPFGYVEGEEEAEAKSANEAGATRKTALKSVAFWLLMIGAIGCCLGAGFNNNQPGIAIEKLAPLMDAKAAGLVGAGMISTAAVGNLLGKIAFGAISDRLGVRPTSAIFIAMLAAAFLLWIFSGSTEMLLVGAFLFGTHNALISVAFPLIVRQLYGGKNFSSIWSLWSMPFTLLGGFSTSIIGFIYAGTGNSYTTSLWIGLIGVAVVAVCVMIACQFIGKIAWDDKPEGKVAENA